MDGAKFGNFSKHSARILRKQLVNKLVDEFLNSRLIPDLEIPSFQRFYGALLFIDISGFTALSVRLNVEELKNHINGYFTTMLDIVDRHGGDVVKFAGDALFIIWQTTKLNEDDIDYPTDEEPGFEAFRRVSVNKAVQCAMEINQRCCDHEIRISTSNTTTPHNTHSSGHFLPNFFSPSSSTQSVSVDIAPTDSNSAKNGDVCFLNVHSGISVGLMGSVDVGGSERSEHFLIGEPLNRVAIAESKAEKGDLVMCPDVHSIVHKHQLMGGNGQLKHDNARGNRVMSFIHTIQHMNPFQHAHKTDKKYEEGHGHEAHDEGGDGGAHVAACGCTLLDNGYWRTGKAGTSSFSGNNNKLKRSRTKQKIDHTKRFDDVLAYDVKIQDAVEADIQTAYDASLHVFKDELQRMFDNGDIHKLHVANRGSTPVTHLKNSMRRRVSIMTRNIDHGALQRKLFEENRLQRNFIHFIHDCLLDDLVRHVHQVARGEVNLTNVSHSQPFLKCVEHYIQVLMKEAQAKDVKAAGPPAQEEDDAPKTPLKPVKSGILRGLSFGIPAIKTSSPEDEKDKRNDEQSVVIPRRYSTGNAVSARTLAVASNPAAGKLQKMRSMKKLTFNDTNLEAELRTVIVLFIKIDLTGVELVVEDPDALGDHFMASNDAFGFLPRTQNERQCDNDLLQSIQCCMNVLTTTFSSKGGQMRQFIVDDKGTVCIGTFGLRGAVNDDNAAAAVEAAKQIIISLQGIGMHASIGITSGKGYCGLVGSPNRHEYAVMGPSTNLSARLMCKAPACGILCDSAVRNCDRVHEFESLGEVVAKGYELPVPIFRPIFKGHFEGGENQEFLQLMTNLNMRSSFANNSDPKQSALAKQRSETMIKQLSMQRYHVKSRRNLLRDGSKLNPQQQEVAQNMQNVLDLQNAAVLRGRNEEIGKILLFCLSESTMSGGINEGSTTRSGEGSVASKDKDPTSGHGDPLFAFTAPTKMMILCGPQGIGKSSIISSISSQLMTNNTRHGVHYNMSLYKNQPCSLHLSIPFYAWKPIIREMLTRVYRVKSRGQLVRMNSNLVSQVDEVEQGLKIALANLSSEIRALKPLLASIGIIPPVDNNETTAELTGLAKLQRTAELLTALIQIYIKLTRELVILTMFDIHSFDLSSLQLLEMVWKHNTGIIILCTLKPVAELNLAVSPTSAAAAGEVANAQQRMSDRGLQQTQHRRSRQSFGTDARNEVLRGILTTPANDQFMQMEITGIDVNATEMLVKDTLKQQGALEKCSTTTIQAIAELSGGNPLYAYELTQKVIANSNYSVDKAMLSKIIASLRSHRIEEIICHRFDQLNHTSQLILKLSAVACANGHPVSFELLSFLINDTANHSEESGLISPTQKSPTASGATVSPSAKAVTKSPPTQKHLNALDTNLCLGLLNILEKEEFLRVIPNDKIAVDMSQDGAVSMKAIIRDINPKTVASTADYNAAAAAGGGTGEAPIDHQREQRNLQYAILSGCSFEFRVSLEQLAIYDLLLDDQKLFMHERISMFYHLKNTAAEVKSVALLCEEAHHWKHATVWAEALLCFYRAAHELIQSKTQLSTAETMQITEFLGLGHTMFTAMQQEMSILFPTEPMTVDDTLHLLGLVCPGIKDPLASTSDKEKRMSDGSMQASTVLSCESEDGPRRANIIAVENIYLLFNGEVALLSTVVELYLQLAVQLETKHTNIDAVNKIIENTLQLICQTKEPFLISSSMLHKYMSSRGSRGLGASSASQGKSGDSAEEVFQLRLFEDVILKALSAYVSNNLWCLHATEITKHKIHLCCHCGLELAKKRAQKWHELHFQMLYATLLNNEGELKEAIDITKTIVSVYDEHKHSTELIAHYGYDRMPQLLALTAHQYVLQAKSHKSDAFIKFATELCLRQKHSPSFYIALVPLTAVCTLLQRHEDIRKILHCYTEHHAAYEYFPKSIVRLYELWLRCMVCFIESRCSSDSNGAASFHALNRVVSSEDIASIEFDLDTVQALNNASTSDTIESRNRSMMADFFILNGKCLDSVIGELCYFYYQFLIQQQKDSGQPIATGAENTAHKYLEKAMKLNNHSFRLVAIPSNKLLFNKFQCLLFRYQLVHTDTHTDESKNEHLVLLQTDIQLFMGKCPLLCEVLKKLNHYSGLASPPHPAILSATALSASPGDDVSVHSAANGTAHSHSPKMKFNLLYVF